MKKKVLITALITLFLILFNAIFFLVGAPDSANASRWISYVAIHIAYLLMVFTPVITRIDGARKVFGIPLTLFSAGYFAVEFFVGLLFVLFNPKSCNAAIIFQLVIFVLYAAGVLMLMIANASAEEAEAEKLNPGVFTEKAGDMLADVMKKVKDGELREAVDGAALALSETPKETRADVLPLEADIISKIKDLRVAQEKADGEAVTALAGELRGMFEQRTAALREPPQEQGV